MGMASSQAVAHGSGGSSGTRAGSIGSRSPAPLGCCPAEDQFHSVNVRGEVVSEGVQQQTHKPLICT